MRHLVRYQSDHRPLLLDFFSLVPNQRDRPFRFIQAWMTHADYRNFVARNWVCNGDLVQAIKDFTVKLQQWNHDVFGNIFRQKNQLLARLAGVQRILDKRESPRHRELETVIMKELDEILLREEMLWHQKSRSEEILWGDKNTSFFHLRTVHRRKRNIIEFLKNENGE